MKCLSGGDGERSVERMGGGGGVEGEGIDGLKDNLRWRELV